MNEVGGSGRAASGLACELRSEVACDLTLRRKENGERRVPVHLSVTDDEELEGPEEVGGTCGTSRLGRSLRRSPVGHGPRTQRHRTPRGHGPVETCPSRREDGLIHDEDWQVRTDHATPPLARASDGGRPGSKSVVPAAV